MSWVDNKPKRPITWADIMDHGVCLPNSRATKEELQDWIVAHADLLLALRQETMNRIRELNLMPTEE